MNIMGLVAHSNYTKMSLFLMIIQVQLLQLSLLRRKVVINKGEG